MTTPAWILDVFGAVMLLVAEVSAGQLVAARARTRGGTDADTAVSQLLMGIALASILVPGLRTLPNAVWAVVFAGFTAWFALCLWRESRGRGAAAVASGRYVPRLVHSAALLYLFAALLGPSVAGSITSVSIQGGMPGMPGMATVAPGATPAVHASTLALIFALLLIACIVHDLNVRAGADDYFQVMGRRLVPGESAQAAAAAGPAAPGETVYADTGRLLVSPAVVKGCQVATGVTMAFILIILL
jgi:Domain of unknown function (DUF5134)